MTQSRPPPRQRKKDLFAQDLQKFGIPVLFSETAHLSRHAIPLCNGIAWSPSGATVTTAGSRSLRVWDPERAQLHSSHEIRAVASLGNVEKLEYCPTREAVLASSGYDGWCRLWDVRTPRSGVSGRGVELAGCQTGDRASFLRWHPNGNDILLGRKDGVIQHIDVRRMEPSQGQQGTQEDPVNWSADCEEKTPERQGEESINDVTFSHDGRLMYAATSEGPVQVLEWPSFRHVRSLEAHAGPCEVVQYSPKYDYLATGGMDGIINIWETERYVSPACIRTHEGPVKDLSCSFDGNYVIAGCGHDVAEGAPGLRITHMNTGDHVYTYTTDKPVVWAKWHPQRYWIAATGDGGGLRIFGAGSSIL